MSTILSFGEVLVDCLPEQNVIGGAPFNVAIHLKRFGHDVSFISKIADDEFGKMIYDFAKQEDIEKGISFDENHPTGYVTVEFEDNEPHYTIEEQKSWQYVTDTNIDENAEVYVYGSLALYFEQNQQTFLKHREALTDCLFVCDLNLRGDFYSKELISLCIDHCDVLKINEDEWGYLKELYKLSSDDEVTDFLKGKGIEKVIRTMSEKGAVVYWDQDKFEASTQLVPQDEFQDAIGAGDGFLASFLHTYLTTRDIQHSLEFALGFAANICRNAGAIPVEKTIY
ncbi:MAG: hypothetical protein GY827_06485 [Cytophagales bacterium]|nr:hypothetical protein [Cytophagales bacterium]